MTCRERDCEKIADVLRRWPAGITLSAVACAVERSVRYVRTLVQLHPDRFALNSNARRVGLWWVSLASEAQAPEG